MSSERSGSPVSGTELVIDASALVKAALIEAGVARLSGWSLHAPSLIWSEVAAATRQLEFRGELDETEAATTLRRALAAPIVIHSSADLVVDALALARGLGWAKTYDAEYIALARAHGFPMLTVDSRLAAIASRFVSLVAPDAT